jgi:predicted acetyltransferase
LAIILFIPNTDWGEKTSLYGFLSLICGTLGSFISIFIPTSFVFLFKEPNWTKDDNGFFIEIKSKEHGLGNATQIQIFIKSEKGYERIHVHEKQDDQGNIKIYANSKFTGKIIVN